MVATLKTFIYEIREPMLNRRRGPLLHQFEVEATDQAAADEIATNTARREWPGKFVNAADVTSK